MSMKQIREYYGVPAKRGGRVRYKPFKSKKALYGTIKSTRDGWINVLMDGEKRPKSYHPAWRMTYL